MGYAKAYGKLILIGEHSVVYGKKALAIPFKSVFTEVFIDRFDGDDHQIKSSYYTGSYKNAPQEIIGLKYIIDLFLTDHSVHDKLSFMIDSNILGQRGLGSSASVARSLIEALYQYTKIDYQADDLIKYIKISEEIHHGKPSGLDMYCILYEKPVMLQKGELKLLDVPLKGYLVVADTGFKSQTKVSVSHVYAQYQQQKEAYDQIFNQMEENAEDVIKSFYESDFVHVGHLMSHTHELLKRIGVSSDRLDDLCQIAIHHGALGAKLTGGGQGGCMFAYTDNLKTASVIHQAFKESGVKHAWIYPLSQKK